MASWIDTAVVWNSAGIFAAVVAHEAVDESAAAEAVDEAPKLMSITMVKVANTAHG